MKKLKKAEIKNNVATCLRCMGKSGRKNGRVIFTAKQSQEKNEWLIAHARHHLPIEER